MIIFKSEVMHKIDDKTRQLHSYKRLLIGKLLADSYDFDVRRQNLGEADREGLLEANVSVADLGAARLDDESRGGVFRDWLLRGRRDDWKIKGTEQKKLILPDPSSLLCLIVVFSFGDDSLNLADLLPIGFLVNPRGDGESNLSPELNLSDSLLAPYE